MSEGEQNKPEKPTSDKMALKDDKKPDKAEKSGDSAKTAAAQKNASADHEQKAAKSSKPARSRAARSSEKRPFPLIAFLALLIAAVAVAAGLWQYRQSQLILASLDELKNRQTQFQEQLSGLTDDISTVDQKQQSLVDRIEQDEDRQRSLSVSLDQLSSQVKSLTIAKGKQPLYWRASEVEYLLTVANHRLTLARDVKTAKQALQDADNRLRAIGDPGLIPVREKISQELNQLNSVALPDIPGVASQLASLMDSVSQLPFISRAMTMQAHQKSDTAGADKEFDGVGQFVKTVWNDLVDGLFTVQRTDQPVEPLLPPEEKQYLRHNLRLKLEQARTALLQSETPLFRDNLAEVQQWLKQYYDVEAAAVSHVLQTVTDLQDKDLDPQLPDISGSLRELRAWMATQELGSQASSGSTNKATVADANDEVFRP
ncbi:MAG: uroporphyrinogen-III C-methyltransferase [Gammaproteobacteria bacterium]